MPIVFIDGEFISVAKVDCQKCHGSGIEITQPTYHSGKIEMAAQFCDCIKIRVSSEALHPVPEKPKDKK